MKLKYVKMLSNATGWIVVIIFLLIIFITLFGCKFQFQENYENKPNNVQSEIIDQVKTGKIDVHMIEQYIKEKKLNKEDLDTIIRAVESENK